MCHGVGGSFDVMAGKVERAPALWQRLGLEWLYRVKQEPRRLWRRYLVTNTLFCGMLCAAFVRSLPGRLTRLARSRHGDRPALIRLSLLYLVITGLAVYAWRDWFKALCGLILLMAVIQHPDMPKNLLGIQGLNPWNLLLMSVLGCLGVRAAPGGPALGPAALPGRPARPVHAGRGRQLPPPDPATRPARRRVHDWRAS